MPEFGPDAIDRAPSVSPEAKRMRKLLAESTRIREIVKDSINKQGTVDMAALDAPTQELFEISFQMFLEDHMSRLSRIMNAPLDPNQDYLGIVSEAGEFVKAGSAAGLEDESWEPELVIMRRKAFKKQIEQKIQELENLVEKNEEDAIDPELITELECLFVQAKEAGLEKELIISFTSRMKAAEKKHKKWHRVVGRFFNNLFS